MTTAVAKITAADVANLAQALTDSAALEKFVGELPAEMVPVYLAGLIGAATNIRALTKGLERRLEADGLTGKHFIVNEIEYGFFGAQQKGWKDVPSLLRNLYKLGLSPADVAEAISELRVTDLRVSCANIKDPEKRAAAIELLEEHRVPKGERGSPSFKLLVDAR